MTLFDIFLICLACGCSLVSFGIGIVVGVKMGTQNAIDAIDDIRAERRRRTP